MLDPARLKQRLLLSSLVFLLLTASAQPQSEPQAPASRAVETQMQNVMYHFTDTITVHIFQLSGKLIPRKDIPIFDDKHTFIMEIEAATISMSTDVLSHVLNENVFAGKDSPLKELSISSEGSQLKIKGKLAQKGNVSFETTGEVQATSEGKIRLHAKHIKAAHLPLKGIMDLFGVELANLINTKKVKGVTAEKDDIVLDPEEILPPPEIRGKLSNIRLENGQLILIFGSGKLSRQIRSGNFMALRGAALQFGKLIMNDTDMVLIDADPRDPFDFFLDHYQEQLRAGYTKITPQFGLRVYMVDYNKLNRRKATSTAAQKPK